MSPPTLRVLAPKDTAPAPASEPSESVAALEDSVAPDATVTALLLPTAPLPLAARVPADTVVEPV